MDALPPLHPLALLAREVKFLVYFFADEWTLVAFLLRSPLVTLMEGGVVFSFRMFVCELMLLFFSSIIYVVVHVTMHFWDLSQNCIIVFLFFLIKKTCYVNIKKKEVHNKPLNKFRDRCWTSTGPLLTVIIILVFTNLSYYVQGGAN